MQNTKGLDLWPKGFGRSGALLDLHLGSEVPPIIQEVIREGHTFVAHNAAGFDAIAWEKLVGGEQPAWFDTLPCCRAAGLPGGLDALGKVLLGRGKDPGTAALKMLCKAKVKGGEYQYPMGTPALWESVLRYNIADVLLLEKVFNTVQDFGEADVLEVHQRINERGIKADRALLEKLLELWHAAESSAVERITGLTGGKITVRNVRSVQQVKRWCAGQGVSLESLNRQKLEDFYANPEECLEGGELTAEVGLVIEVLKFRQQVVRAGRGKIERTLSLIDPEDDRVRRSLVYWGAHTGRWSGRGIQPHNMHRGVSKLDLEGIMQTYQQGSLDLEELKHYAGKVAPAGVDDVLSSLFRPVFMADTGKRLVIIDYGAIEARGVAWVAGEPALLTVFNDPAQDVYCDMASKIFGRTVTKEDKAERQIGKVTVLGAGYGMSANRFGAYCCANQIDLSSVGVSADGCINTYRSNYPWIASRWQGTGEPYGIWYRYQHAARIAVEQNVTQYAGRCNFRKWKDGLVIGLPSGRNLIYRNARMEQRIPGYRAFLGIKGGPKPAIVYDHPYRGASILYGGLITENIVQAICRDLLATALVLLEDAGYPVVMHVHDEVMLEVEEEKAVEVLRDASRIMSTSPGWAAGFPVVTEGFTSKRYIKSPWKGDYQVNAIGGKIFEEKTNE